MDLDFSTNDLYKLNRMLDEMRYYYHKESISKLEQIDIKANELIDKIAMLSRKKMRLNYIEALMHEEQVTPLQYIEYLLMSPYVFDVLESSFSIPYRATKTYSLSNPQLTDWVNAMIRFISDRYLDNHKVYSMFFTALVTEALNNELYDIDVSNCHYLAAVDYLIKKGTSTDNNKAANSFAINKTLINIILDNQEKINTMRGSRNYVSREHYIALEDFEKISFNFVAKNDLDTYNRLMDLFRKRNDMPLSLIYTVAISRVDVPVDILENKVLKYIGSGVVNGGVSGSTEYSLSFLDKYNNLPTILSSLSLDYIEKHTKVVFSEARIGIFGDKSPYNCIIKKLDDDALLKCILTYDPDDICSNIKDIRRNVNRLPYKYIKKLTTPEAHKQLFPNGCRSTQDKKLKEDIQKRVLDNSIDFLLS